MKNKCKTGSQRNVNNRILKEMKIAVHIVSQIVTIISEQEE